MQYRRDTGQEGYRTGRMQDRRDAGKIRYAGDFFSAEMVEP